MFPQIAACCHQLQKFVIRQYTGSLSALFMSSIFTNCPNIASISASSTHFSVVSNYKKERSVRVDLCNMYIDEFCDLCAGIPLPIVHLSSPDASGDDFHAFADALGHSLKSWDTHGGRVSEPTLQYAFSHCAVLEEVSLYKLIWTKNSVATLQCLPSSLTELTLERCPLKDEDLLALLEGFKSRNLKKITLRDCRNLSKNVISSIPEEFSHLKDICVEES